MTNNIRTTQVLICNRSCSVIHTSWNMWSSSTANHRHGFDELLPFVSLYNDTFSHCDTQNEVVPYVSNDMD